MQFWPLDHVGAFDCACAGGAAGDRESQRICEADRPGRSAWPVAGGSLSTEAEGVHTNDATLVLVSRATRSELQSALVAGALVAVVGAGCCARVHCH